MISIFRIANLQFLEVSLVVHIPAKYNGAEAEPISCDPQELLLGHELAAEGPININTGDFDLGIIFQDMLQRIVGDLAISPVGRHLDVGAQGRPASGAEMSLIRISARNTYGVR